MSGGHLEGQVADCTILLKWVLQQFSQSRMTDGYVIRMSSRMGNIAEDAVTCFRSRSRDSRNV